MLEANNLLDLPIEILANILKFTSMIKWQFLAICNDKIYEYTYNNTYIFVNLFTQINTFMNTTSYTLFGKLHHINGPAICRDDKHEYYINNKLHRDDDLPAAILYNNKTNQSICSAWYINGENFRIGTSPDIICKCTGKELWYKNDKLIKTLPL